MPITRDKLNARFESEFKKLNPEQLQAVSSLEGPVMVIAGPGTGKTQILANRIGKILLETDAAPNNILCLTYTEAGVVAMRRRLQDMIGPDAYAVNIYTFHAFCNDIIQDNLSLFEKNSLDPISDLERVDLLMQLIDEFPKGHPLKRYRGEVYYEADQLYQLFSTMKREGWSPSWLNEKIDEYLASLPTRDDYIYKKSGKGYQKGDLKLTKLQDETEKMEKLRAAVFEFDKFQEKMRRANRYDFDDMINWVIRAFETNPALLARYQEQFLYILVDEFQDTSGTQDKLVNLLCNYWESPNIFVVGDDDQSIYRFQGANVENMENFNHRYADGLTKVVLTKNYRSTQTILDLAGSLIQSNQLRLVNDWPGLTKELEASNPGMQKIQAGPVINEYASQKEEMMGTVLQIKDLLAAGVPEREIGVIYKENKYGEELATYFKHLSIPYYTKRSIDIFSIPLAKQILLICKWISAEHDTPYSGDEMLFKILHFSWFGIAPIQIAKLSVETNDTRHSSNPKSMRLLLYEKSHAPARDLFSAPYPENLKQVSALLENLVSAVPNIPLIQLFEKVIVEGGVLQHVMQSTDKFNLMRVVTALFDFVKDETRRKPSLELTQWLRIVDLMETEEIGLPLVDISGNEKGVNLLTAHGAKGLEFDHVFIVGANADLWEKKRVNNRNFKFPDNLAEPEDGSSNAKLTEKETRLEELRRLFYVALTRARSDLRVSYTRMKADGKAREASQFVAELMASELVSINPVSISPEEQFEFQALPFGKLLSPELKKVEEDFIAPLLEKFVMNVTALNNYLDCPLNFYFNNLLRIPAGRSEAAVFGSAVHYALEKLFFKMKERGEQFPTADEFLSDFEWYMHRHRENFTRQQFERRLDYGLDTLRAYYEYSIHQWNRIVSIEMPIRNVVLDGIPLKGNLDKLEFDRNKVVVVDYKTGDFDSALNTKKHFQTPNDNNPLGGNYWRQAVFYKLLVENFRGKNWMVDSVEFDFVEPDKKKVYRKHRVEVGPADIQTVIAQIRDTWEHIQTRDFYKGCGKPTCRYCNFVKDNHLYSTLTDLGEEADEGDEDLEES